MRLIIQIILTIIGGISSTIGIIEFYKYKFKDKPNEKNLKLLKVDESIKCFEDEEVYKNIGIYDTGKEYKEYTFYTKKELKPNYYTCEITKEEAVIYESKSIKKCVLYFLLSIIIFAISSKLGG